jgi:DNA-binding transcriptional ArsR family regulator
MKLSKERIAFIKKTITDSVKEHPTDLVGHIVDVLGISRPTVMRYINELVDEGSLQKEGKGRGTVYSLLREIFVKKIEIKPDVSEDEVWHSLISEKVSDLPLSQRRILQYGFTEMVNNALDHSGSKSLLLVVDKRKELTALGVGDDGVGIFNKIKVDLGLNSAEEAVFELGKGKFTSDPSKHSGEGIFFTSKVFSIFKISSKGLSFLSGHNKHDTLTTTFETAREINYKITGTAVAMILYKDEEYTLSDVFNEFADPDTPNGLKKTLLTVSSLKRGDEMLVSRSQGKRLMARLDKFSKIVLDFDGVDEIGQAFADEVFRVFQQNHPDSEISAKNVSENVRKMIRHVGFDLAN